MHNYTFLSLQKIAAEKDLRNKARLLKTLVKQAEADKKLVLEFLQKQIKNSHSLAWINFCHQVLVWLQEQEKVRRSFEINEDKFFSILGSDSHSEEKLSMLSALKEHIKYKNSRIIEWIVHESMVTTSSYFDLVCEITDYLLAKHIFAVMDSTLPDKDFVDFADFFRADFRQKILWLRSCPSQKNNQTKLLQWLNNLVLSETNPFVIAEFLVVYPLCAADNTENIIRLLDILPNFLDWPFTQIKMRTLQALAQVTAVETCSHRVRSIASKIMTQSRCDALRIQAEYLLSLCDNKSFTDDSSSAASVGVVGSVPALEPVLTWEEENQEPDTALLGFLIPVQIQTKAFVHNTGPALLIIVFLLCGFLLVYLFG